MFDDAKIPIPCPSCGKEAEETVAWLKTHDHFNCAGCGATIRVEAEKLLAGLTKVDQSIDKMLSGLRNLGKK